jgi:hypothetical protein
VHYTFAVKDLQLTFSWLFSFTSPFSWGGVSLQIPIACWAALSQGRTEESNFIPIDDSVQQFVIFHSLQKISANFPPLLQ